MKYGEDTDSDASGGDEFNGENDLEGNISSFMPRSPIPMLY